MRKASVLVAVLLIGGCSSPGSSTAPSNTPSVSHSASATTSASSEQPASVATPSASMLTADGIPPDTKFYADDWQQEILKEATNDEERALLSRISSQPQAVWMTGGSWDKTTMQQVTEVSKQQSTTPVVVMYNIPTRDCGSYSAGGVADGDAYLAWVRQVTSWMDGRAWIILEPDALAASDECGGAQRLQLLHDAGVILRAAGHRVYIDAGHSHWLSPAEAAEKLHQVGADGFDGIALNVSNFETTQANQSYAAAISAAFGAPLHYVVDTSRNGNGPTSDHQWCNPPGRALGEAPRLGSGELDALLWVKTPGGSDGTCNGGPSSGEFWKQYALELARNSG